MNYTDHQFLFLLLPELWGHCNSESGVEFADPLQEGRVQPLSTPFAKGIRHDRLQKIVGGRETVLAGFLSISSTIESGNWMLNVAM